MKINERQYSKSYYTMLDFTRCNAQEIELHKSPIQDFSLKNECLEHKKLNLVILSSDNDEAPILTIKLKEYDEDQEAFNIKLFHCLACVVEKLVAACNPYHPMELEYTVASLLLTMNKPQISIQYHPMLSNLEGLFS
ncbi:hypothetical protein ACR3K2_11200 [Cryptosporidium serpentis]